MTAQRLAKRLMFRIFNGYVWLIGRERCLCRFNVPLLSRLCGRIDDLLVRAGYW